MPGRPSKDNATSSLRIIGGKWRSRKVPFQSARGLRPTPDRVRETLFNWLAADVPGARCADLFAGSGALGVEALSRGAAHCTFVDTNSTALNTIRSVLHTLKADKYADVRAMTAQAYCLQETEPFHIVFLDPPFGLDLVEPCCQSLDTHSLLAPAAAIYIETSATENPPTVPALWELAREKKAGDVAYRLYRTPAI